MPIQDTKVEKLSDKVVELSIVMSRVEELIDKLSEISSNLTLLVHTNATRIEHITSNVAQDRLINQASLDRIEKKMDKLETIGTKEFDELKRDIEKNFVRKENFEPLQKIIYGLVALTFTAIGGAVLNLIMK